MNAQPTSLYRRILALLLPPPLPNLSAIQDRRYLLTGIALLTLPSMLLTSLWPFIDRNMIPALLGSAALLVLAIALNRAGWFNLAAIITLTAIEIPIFVGALVSFNPIFRSVDQVLVFVSAPILVACLICSLPYAALFTAANLIAIVVVPIAVRQLPLTSTYFALFATLIISAVGLFAAILQNRHIRRIEQQSAALIESEGRYRDLFDAASETIIVHDSGGKMLEANAAFERMFGFPFAERRGDSLASLLCPTDSASALERLKQPSGEPFEGLCLRADGTRLNAEFRVKEHEYGGKRMRVVSIRDVTAAREALERAAALDIEREKVQLLERFIGHMSHDLRTPLSVMKTSLYLTERTLDDPARSRRYLATLDSQVTHVQQIIEDMLAMTRLNRATSADFVFARADINRLVSEVCDPLQAAAQSRQQTLTLALAANLPQGWVEETEFRKMARQLIDNALAYSPDGGTVRVETEREGDWLLLKVIDSGIGIAPDDLPHIFEHFYRADAARGTEKGGAGLGLSIAQRIAEVHGGSIRVESEVGAGSTFTARLPVTPTDKSDVP